LFVVVIGLVLFCFLGCGFYGESWKYEDHCKLRFGLCVFVVVVVVMGGEMG
jgi:hypothetical protein